VVSDLNSAVVGLGPAASQSVAEPARNAYENSFERGEGGYRLLVVQRDAYYLIEILTVVC
jgi:hypothetical protein